ncbi:MAG: hypothetical protein D6730_05980 [Bacteroidetes bacterium]|nr:MAG: hypothetical protein D6730_05980 [Bacteroidota bacterium]
MALIMFRLAFFFCLFSPLCAQSQSGLYVQKKGTLFFNSFFGSDGIIIHPHASNNYEKSSYVFVSIEPEMGLFISNKWEVGVYGSYFRGRGDSTIQPKLDYYGVGIFHRFYPLKAPHYLEIGYGLTNGYVTKDGSTTVVTPGLTTQNLAAGAGFNFRVLKKYTNSLFLSVDIRAILCFNPSGCRHTPRSVRGGIKYLIYSPQ